MDRLKNCFVLANKTASGSVLLGSDAKELYPQTVHWYIHDTSDRLAQKQPGGAMPGQPLLKGAKRIPQLQQVHWEREAQQAVRAHAQTTFLIKHNHGRPLSCGSETVMVSFALLLLPQGDDLYRPVFRW